MSWQSVETYDKKKCKRVLLRVDDFEGKQVIVIGGWDDHWTGRCWVYENARVPVGTEPSAWQPLPPLMDE